MRLAVFADLHADDLGQSVDPATGLNRRFLDALDMARWVARDAHDRGADALVFAGDATEKYHPAPWRTALIGEAIAEFPGPVILARGNHDGLRAGRSIVDVLAERPDWHGSSRPRVVVVGDVAIAVMPYMDRHDLRTVAGYEALPEAQVLKVLGEHYLAIARGLYVEASAKAGRTVLVLHQALSGGRMSDAQQALMGAAFLVVDESALAAIGFDAVLAGHFHLAQVLRERPLVAYAGAPLRTDFGEADQQKSYLIVDVGDRTGYEVVPTPARRFVTLRGEAGYQPDVVRDAVVRGLDLDRTLDLAHLRAMLEADGAFDITQLVHRRAEAAAPSRGLSETLSPKETLESYFEQHPDRDALVERGRRILDQVAA